MIPDGFKPFSVDLDPDDEGRVFSFIMLDKSHELAQEMCARINAGSIAEPGATPLEAIISESPDGLITEWDSDNYPERIVELRDKADAYDKQAAELSQLRSELERVKGERDAIRELMNSYNLGGWTDAIAPMKRALAAESKLTASESARRVLVRLAKALKPMRLGHLCLHPCPICNELWDAFAAVDSLKLLEENNGQ